MAFGTTPIVSAEIRHRNQFKGETDIIFADRHAVNYALIEFMFNMQCKYYDLMHECCCYMARFRRDNAIMLTARGRI